MSSRPTGQSRAGAPGRGRVALLTPDLRTGDAVGEDTLRLEQQLTGLGRECRIFAPTGQSGLGFLSPRRLTRFLRDPTRDVLLYQYAVDYQAGLDAFARWRGPRILRHHNVTPPEFYEPYHRGIAEACRRGRERLADFVALQPDLFLPASEFNLEELVRLGAPRERCLALMPLGATRGLIDCEADLTTIGRFSCNPRPAVVLSVGRVVPNKGHRLLLDSFACLAERFDSARLLVVGSLPAELATYHAELRSRAVDLGIAERVWFSGAVSAGVLKACLLSADLLACTSEHEGFCVPLVEAMLLGVPIVALARAAVPETAGDAALLQRDADPKSLGAAFERVLVDRSLVRELTTRGLERARESYSAERAEALLADALGRVVE